MQYSSMSKEQLCAEKEKLCAEYEEYVKAELDINMTRGKPCTEQLDLSQDMLKVISSNEDCFTWKGFDCRNYGLVDGLDDAKRIFSPIIGVPWDQIIVGGNSSLNLMYDAVARNMLYGVAGGNGPWIKQGEVKFICPTPGGDVLPAFSKMIIGRFFGVIPRSLVWILAAVFLLWLPLRRSRFGQSIYAIGGGEYASFVSGINIKRTKLWVYGLAGVFCAMSGVLLTASTMAGDPTGCEGFTLNAVAATVLGGTSLAGGKGSFVGTVAGVIVFTLILALLIFWGVNSYYQSAASGIMLVVALSIDFVQRFISEKKRIQVA